MAQKIYKKSEEMKIQNDRKIKDFPKDDINLGGNYTVEERRKEAIT